MKAQWFIALFIVAVSCSWSHHASRPITPGDITLLTDLPRGGAYTDDDGSVLEYRVFRIHVSNNSAYPAEFTMDLPGSPVPLLPDTGRFIHVFLFPDAITPDIARDTFDFGIKGSVQYVDTRTKTPTSLRTTLAPGQEHLLYIGVVFSQDGLDGLGRAELFIRGQHPKAAYFPEGAIPTGTASGNGLALVFGVAIDPPKHYAFISCGWIAFDRG